MKIDKKVVMAICLIAMGIGILIKLDLRGMSFAPYGYLGMILIVSPIGLLFV